MHLYFHLSIITTIFVFHPHVVAGSTFSSTHFGVALNLRQFLPAAHINISTRDVQYLISKVASKFNKIKMEVGRISLENNLNSGGGDFTLDMIPNVVALYNQQSENQSERGDHNKPVELLLKISQPARQTSYSQHKLIFNETISLVQKANSIYPGTVSTLLVSHEQTEFRAGTKNSIESLAVLRYVNFILTNLEMDHLNYKVGIVFHLKECSSEFGLTLALEKLFRPVDMLMFVAMPDEVTLSRGVNATFPTLSKLLTGCIEKVRMFNENLEIGFETGWTDTSSVEEFLSFWKLVNDFAVETNTTAIVHQAFDSPFAEDTLKRHAGWWKWALPENASGLELEVADLDFVEKEGLVVSLSKERFNRMLKDSSDSTNYKNSESSTTENLSRGTLIVIIAAFFTIIFVTLGFLMWSRNEVTMDGFG